VLDFRRADAMRQRAEGAVRRGVAVAADDRHARQGEALFRSDDVDDALADIVLRIIFDAEIGGVDGQLLDLDAAFLVLDAETGDRARSARCDRRRRASFQAHGPCGRSCAGLRRPAARSPRGPGGGRCREDRCRRPVGRPCGRPRSCRREYAVRSWRYVRFSMHRGYGAWWRKPAGRSVDRQGSTKSAVERTGNSRKETCRQAIMILQHENMRPNATKLGFHGQ
jgi:hypothetical protein